MQALRGDFFTFDGDPDDGGRLVHAADAIAVIGDGKIQAFGPAAEVLPALPPGTPLQHYRRALITAGFIDCHTHYAQMPIIGAGGAQLLEWLQRHALPAEQACASVAHARQTAGLFLDETLRNGVTTAAVFGTVHPHSVDVLFEAAAARGQRLIAGKVMMDRNAPENLLDDAQRSYDDSKALIERWRGRGRLHYAITPRFAATSTPAQLAAAGALRREHPECFVHTHVAENLREVEWVAALFPERRGYLDVYAHHGLLGRRTLLAHAVHLTEDEWQVVHATGAAVAHCPTSNLFLGSGLFDLRRALRADRPVPVGLGTDIGAGTTFSMLATMAEACKVAALRGQPLGAQQAFYLATRGAARALDLEGRIGTVAAGMDADLVVLDLDATPLIAARVQNANDLDEVLYVLMTLGDDRAVRATYVGGKCVWAKASEASPDS